jgi:uncharacterized protein YcgI (DUF1989 family)
MKEVSVPGQKYFDPENPGRREVDRAFYDRLRETPRRRLVREFIVPKRTGRAWALRQGQLCRIVAIECPQAADTLPYLRPMLTFTDDTVPQSEGGVRPLGLPGTRCDPYLYKLITGEEVDYTCHTLLSRAVPPLYLTELDVHDLVNLFQPAHLDPADEIPIMDTVPARRGDFVDFFAEIDLLCGLAACQSGDASISGSQVAGGQRLRGDGRGDPFPTCKDLGVEIYDIDQDVLGSWSPPEPVDLSSVYGPHE